jgi:hypothetical protein
MTVDEIYLLIADKINQGINEDWQKAEALIERIDKVVGFTGSYIDLEGESKSLETNFGFFDAQAIHELHTITTEGGHNRWNKLKFMLSPTGKFEMDFIWDQEYQDKIDQLNK